MQVIAVVIASLTSQLALVWPVFLHKILQILAGTNIALRSEISNPEAQILHSDLIKLRIFRCAVDSRQKVARLWLIKIGVTYRIHTAIPSRFQVSE